MLAGDFVGKSKGAQNTASRCSIFCQVATIPIQNLRPQRELFLTGQQ